MPPKKHAPSVPKAVPAAKPEPVVVVEAAVVPEPKAEPKATPKGIMYEVGRRSKDVSEVVFVRAESGDEAAAKGSKDGFSVVAVVPA